MPHRNALELSQVAFPDDVELAEACARGDASALARFDQEIGPVLRAAVHRFARDSDHAQELCQRVWEQLFVAAPGRRARIGEYMGRGRLRGWVRVVATRVALKEKRSAPGAPTESLGSLLDVLPCPNSDPEIDVLCSLGTAAVKAAFARAAAQLSSRERNVLRQYYVYGVTLANIGTCYGVHEGTASRWLGHAREQLVAIARKDFARTSGQDDEFKACSNWCAAGST